MWVHQPQLLSWVKFTCDLLSESPQQTHISPFQEMSSQSHESIHKHLPLHYFHLKISFTMRFIAKPSEAHRKIESDRKIYPSFFRPSYHTYISQDQWYCYIPKRYTLLHPGTYLGLHVSHTGARSPLRAPNGRRSPHAPLDT